MLVLDGALGFMLFALWVFRLFEVITTDDALCRRRFVATDPADDERFLRQVRERAEEQRQRYREQQRRREGGDGA